MDFRLKTISSKLFVCILLMCSCCDSHKSYIKGFQVVWATDYSEDGLDFLLNKDTTYIYPDDTSVFKEKINIHPLSNQEFSLVKDILKNYFDYHLYDRDGDGIGEPFRLRKYFRQYIGYKEKDSLYVFVNLYTHFPTITDSKCLCTIGPSERVLIYNRNGGRNFGTVIINMEQKRVVYFKISNADSNYIEGHYSEKELKSLFPHLGQ